MKCYSLALIAFVIARLMDAEEGCELLGDNGRKGVGVWSFVLLNDCEERLEVKSQFLSLYPFFMVQIAELFDCVDSVSVVAGMGVCVCVRWATADHVLAF